jgi:hypothetical protein
MKNTTKLFALACLLAVSAFAQKAEPLKPDEIAKPISTGKGLTVRYIANEGVLIASGGKQILIDGLHREYKPDYLFPPPEMQGVAGERPSSLRQDRSAARLAHPSRSFSPRVDRPLSEK